MAILAQRCTQRNNWLNVSEDILRGGFHFFYSVTGSLGSILDMWPALSQFLQDRRSLEIVVITVIIENVILAGSNKSGFIQW